MVSNLNTMMWAAREPVENRLLVLELCSGIWIPRVPTTTKALDQVCRHTWRLSMDRRLVDTEPEDKAWGSYHIALQTCHPPWYPAMGTTMQVRSGGSSLQAAR